MDAHALLTAQGWRGKGHSLHHSSDNHGLTAPILVSQKQNNFGVGKKQHKTSDMWWLNAFDSSLKGLDTSTEGKVVQTVTSSGLDLLKKGGGRFAGNGAGGGLYSVFVKGEGLEGTIEKQKTKKEVVNGGLESIAPKETKEERRARKAAKRAARAAAEAEAETMSSAISTPAEPAEEEVDEVTETKEQRKERRRLRRLRREEAEKEAVDFPESTKSTKRKKRRKD